MEIKALDSDIILCFENGKANMSMGRFSGGTGSYARILGEALMLATNAVWGSMISGNLIMDLVVLITVQVIFIAPAENLR